MKWLEKARKAVSMNNAREVREMFEAMKTSTRNTKTQGIIMHIFDHLNSSVAPREIVETVIKQSICSPGGEVLIGIDQLDESGRALIPSILRATAKAFPGLRNEMPEMAVSVYRELMSPPASNCRRLSQDALLITGFMGVYDDIWGDTQGSEFLEKFCILLHTGIKLRWWKSSPVTKDLRPHISSGVKHLFDDDADRVNAVIKEIFRSISFMVGDCTVVFFSPNDSDKLEVVLCNELSSKALNKLPVERRISLLVPSEAAIRSS